MTIAAAIKDKKGQVWIAADTLEQDDMKQYGTKLVKIKDYYIATAGLSNVQSIIEGLARSSDWVEALKLDTVQDVEAFSDEVWDALKERVKKWNESSRREDSGGDEILITTPTKIFRSNRFGIVREVEDFAAIGSGSAYTYAVLYYDRGRKLSFKSDKDFVVFLEQALKVSIHFDPSCGGDIEIRKVVVND